MASVFTESIVFRRQYFEGDKRNLEEKGTTQILDGGRGRRGEEQIRRMKSKDPITKSASSLKLLNQEKGALNLRNCI